MHIRRYSRLTMFAVCFIVFSFASIAFADASLSIETTGAPDGTVTATVELDGNMTASGVQFALSYDSNMLTLTDVKDGALAGSYTVNDTQNGSVQLVWYNINGKPVNGSANMLTLSFTPKSSGTTIIGFDESMDTLVVDSELNNVQTTLKAAELTVKGPSSVYHDTRSPLIELEKKKIKIITGDSASFEGSSFISIILCVAICTIGILIWRQNKE